MKEQNKKGCSSQASLMFGDIVEAERGYNQFKCRLKSYKTMRASLMAKGFSTLWQKSH